MRRPGYVQIARNADTGGGSGMADTGSGGSGGGQGGGGAGDSSATPPVFDWSGALGTRHGDFAPVLEAKGWKAPADVLAAYTDLEKASASRVAIPGEGATDEERAAFYAALGRPATAQDYGLAKPENVPDAEWDGERMGRFASRAHALGLSSAQVKGIVDWLGTDTIEQITAFQAELPRRQEAQEAALRDGIRAAFGPQADAKLELAKRAFQTYVTTPEAQAAVDALSAKAGDLNIIKMFAQIGADIGESRLRGGGGAGGGATQETARDELTRLKADPEFRQAFTDASHPKHKELVAKHNALAELAARSRTA